MRVVAQLRERFFILMAYAAFSITFISCRSMDNLPQIFVTANYIRANVVVSAIYYAGLHDFFFEIIDFFHE